MTVNGGSLPGRAAIASGLHGGDWGREAALSAKLGNSIRAVISTSATGEDQSCVPLESRPRHALRSRGLGGWDRLQPPSIAGTGRARQRPPFYSRQMDNSFNYS